MCCVLRACSHGGVRKHLYVSEQPTRSNRNPAAWAGCVMFPAVLGFILKKKELICSLWSWHVAVLSMCFLCMSSLACKFQTFRAECHESSILREILPKLKFVIDVVTLVDCVLFCLIHFFVMFLKSSPFFPHQYVNIDGLYIKSGHNKINAIYCLAFVISNTTHNLGLLCNFIILPPNVSYRQEQHFWFTSILSLTFQSDQGISGFTV